MSKFYIKSFIISIGLCLALGLQGCAGAKPKLSIPSELPESSRKIPKNPNVALVLGSGGARGYAHAGVLSVLEREHIPIDIIIGSSAGSMMGALYADKKSSDAVYQLIEPATFWTFADVANVPNLSGVVKGYHLEKFLMQHLDAKTFDELKIPLVVVTTDLTTGEPFIIQSGPIPPAILASSAIPGVVQPVRLYGHILVDGGVATTVPVTIAEQFHPKMILSVDIGIDLTPEVSMRSSKIVMRSYDIISNHLTQYQIKASDVIINPSLGYQSAFDMKHRMDAYQAGIDAAEKMMPEIKKVLKQKGIPLRKTV